MWKGKKSVILVSVLAAVLLFGATAGITFAQSGTDRPDPNKDILARVAQILGIDQQKLTDAYKQAKSEVKAQNPPKTRNTDEFLAALVKDGKITQAQADQYKAWKAQKPAGDPKTNAEAFKTWMKSRPDIPFPKPAPPSGSSHSKTT
jgi:hypothetical protein